MEQVEKSYPCRAYATAVIDINGKTVFITKYFKPLEPPESVLELSTNKKIQLVGARSMVRCQEHGFPEYT